MPDQKVSLEIEILQRSIDSFSQKITELENKLNKLQNTPKKIKIETDIEKAKKAIEDLEAQLKKLIISDKTLANIKETGKAISDLSLPVFNFGKSCVDSAVKVSKFEGAIKNTSKTTEEYNKKLDKIYSLAAKPIGFNLIELEKAGANISKFSIDYEKAMERSVNIASSVKSDLSKTSDLVSKAMAGNSRSILSLLNLMGFSRQELIKLGAETNKYNNIVSNSPKTLKALEKAMDSFSGSTEKMKNNYTANLKAIQNQIELLKIGIGKELMPDLVKLMQVINQQSPAWIKWIKDNQDLIVSLIKISGVITGLSIAINTLTPVITGAINAFNLLSAVAIANPIAAITLAVGSGVFAWEEYIEKQALLKQQHIEEDLKPVAKELSNINNIINEINNKKLSIDTSKIKAQIEDLRNDSRELQISEQGNKPFFIQSFDKNQTVVSITNPYRIDKIDIENGEKLSSVYQKINGIYEGIIDKEKNGTELTEKEKQAKIEIENLLRQIDISLSGFSPKQDEYNKKLDDTKQKIENISPAIKKLSNDINNAFSALTAGLNTAADKFADKANSKTGEKPSFSAGKDNTDDQRLQALQKKFNYHKDLQKADKESQSQYLSWLNEFKGKYKFTNEELLQIDVEVQTAKDKINQYNKKQADKAEKDREQALKKEEDDFKTEYNIFKKSLDEKLKYGKITSDDYVKQTLKFAKDHQKFITPELGDEMNLRNQEVFDKHNQELLKQKEEEGRKLEENQKKQEALQEKKLLAQLEINKTISDNEIETENQIQKAKIDNINTQILKRKELAKSNVYTATQEQEDLNSILKSETEYFISSEARKKQTFETNIAKKIETFRDSGVEEIEIDKYITSEKKKLQAELLADFKSKELEKQSVVTTLKEEISSVDKELKELKAKKEELNSKSSFLSGEEASPLKSLNDAFDGHMDNYQAKFEEGKSIDEQIKTAEDKKSQLQLKEIGVSQALATLKQNEAIATGEVVTALQNFSGALNDASSSSGSGGDGGTSTGTEEDEQGFQNTYSGTMNSIEFSSGDSYNSIIAGGDTKNNPANKQIGKTLYYGNLPQNKNVEDAGNIPQNYSAEKGSWSIKNLSSDKQSSLNTMLNFLTGIARNMKDINNSITNNKIMNSIDNSRITNQKSNINIHIDNKSQNITNPETKRRINDFISLALAGKTVR